MLSLPNKFVRVGECYLNLSHISRIQVVPAEIPRLKLFVMGEWIYVEGDEAVNLLYWINDRFLVALPKAEVTPRSTTGDEIDMDIWGGVLTDDENGET